MSEKIEIRILHIKDLQAIVDLGAKIEPTPAFYWPPEFLVPEVKASPGAGIWLNDLLIGVVLWRELLEAKEISLVMMDPMFQGKGHMRSLMSWILREIPANVWWLDVHELNLKAISLYESLGFQRSGRRANYYRDKAAAFLYTYRKTEIS